MNTINQLDCDDFKTQRSHSLPQLIVMARDQGTVPYMDFGTVEVKILDMNDNTPLFTTVS